MIQDQILNHYFDKCNSEGTPFLLSYIKFTSKTWKNKHYLNVGKHVGIFGDYSEGFIDFIKWKHANISEKIHFNYSKLDYNKRKITMNDIMTSLNLSKTCKVIRVIYTKLSVVISQDKIWTSIRMLFKDNVSYDIIKNLNAIFWRNFHESWYSRLSEETKEVYLIILKYQL